MATQGDDVLTLWEIEISNLRYYYLNNKEILIYWPKHHHRLIGWNPVYYQSLTPIQLTRVFMNLAAVV